MRVQLIHPPDTMRVGANLPPFVDERRGSNPPLGLLYLAGALRARGGHVLDVVDAPCLGLDHAAVEQRVRAFDPDVVGISSLTFALPDAQRVAASIRRVSPRTTVVLGGPQASLYPRESVGLEGIDVAVVGEGEEVFPALLEHLEAGQDPAGVAGLAYRRDGEIVETGFRDPPPDLDALPFPARDLTDVARYNSVLARQGPITVMMTSRGCPYACRFCTSPGPFGKLRRAYRSRSAPDVVDEMEECQALGIREILIYDDLFTTERRRTVAICREILRRDLRVRFDIRSTVNQMDRELLGWLREAGCVRINYGVEAGTQEVVDVLDKRIQLSRVREIFRQTRAAGIQTLGYFMLGSPGEGEAELQRTIDFARELDPDYAHFSVTTLFPGSHLYEWGRDRGLLDGDPWRAFAADPRPGFEAPFWTERLSREALLGWLDRSYRRFYLRPGYVLRRLLALRRPEEVRMKLVGFLRVLTG